MNYWDREGGKEREGEGERGDSSYAGRGEQEEGSLHELLVEASIRVADDD
jgi:hypothetical protein